MVSLESEKLSAFRQYRTRSPMVCEFAKPEMKKSAHLCPFFGVIICFIISKLCPIRRASVSLATSKSKLPLRVFSSVVLIFLSPVPSFYGIICVRRIFILFCLTFFFFCGIILLIWCGFSEIYRIECILKGNLCYGYQKNGQDMSS